MADDEARQAAIRRLKAKQGFYSYLATFVFVNAVSIIVWAITGAGYFWPGWVLLGTGIGLFWTAWGTFGARKDITEADIEREMGKGGGTGPVA